MRIKALVFLFIILILIGVYFCCGIVGQNQAGVIVKAGKINAAKVLKPGEYVSIPYFHQVQVIDLKQQTTNLNVINVSTKDNQAITVSILVLWHIDNPAKAIQQPDFLQKGFGQNITDQGVKLASLSIAQQSLALILSNPASFMNKLQASLSTITKPYGINIDGLYIENISYPKSLDKASVKHLNDLAQSIADNLTQQGQQQADQIKQKGAVQLATILVQSNAQVAAYRGLVQGQVAAIYAPAYHAAPAFFDFYRSLMIYKQVFANQNAMIVVKPEGFFKYFNNSKSK